jgi:hypothetical protein
MEVPQGKSLRSHLKQAKMSFFFYKIREQASRTGPTWAGGDWYLWEERGGGKSVGG